MRGEEGSEEDVSGGGGGGFGDDGGDGECCECGGGDLVCVVVSASCECGWLGGGSVDRKRLTRR